MKKAALQLSFLLIALLVDLCDSGDNKLYLLDLYTCVDEFEDYCNQIPRKTVRAAIELANSRDDILPGYTLSTLNKLDDDESLLVDGKVIITSAIFDNFYKELDIVMTQPNSSISPIVLGSPFSFVSEYTVDVLGKYQNFVQVNFKSTFAKLDNSPFFYRIGPNEEFFNAVRLELLMKNKWAPVGILSSSGTFSLTAEDLEQNLVEINISVINMASFAIEGRINESVQNHLTCLKEKDIRIIVALLTVAEVPLIMCAAYDMGLIDDHHVWILPEMNLNDIRRVAKQYNMCDVDIVLRNALMVGENYHNFENHSLPFGTNDLDDLLIKYNNISSTTNLTDIPGYNLSRVIFDATWAVILALNNSIEVLAEKGWSLEESVNQNGVDQRFLGIIKESLNQVEFSGLSGIVDFSNRDNNTHRMGNSFMTNGTFDTARISQIINKSSCTVEIYKATNATTIVADSGSCDYTWGNNPPTTLNSDNYPKVPSALLIFTIVISVIFIFVSVTLTVCIIAMRKNEYIKTSSLTLNIIIIIGCDFVFFSSVPRLLTYGAKQYGIDETQSTALCQVTYSFDKFGWNLVCVFIFLKSWRLYRIHNNKLLKKKIRYISEKAIFVITLMLLLPTVTMLVLQATLDRVMVKTEDGQNKYSLCDQYSISWEAVFGVYNIVIAVASLWQAWHVSQMTIKNLAFLEGKISVRLLIILAISTVCLMVIDLTLNERHVATIFRIMESMSFFVIIISTIFLPKAYLILKQTKNSRSAAKVCTLLV